MVVIQAIIFLIVFQEMLSCPDNSWELYGDHCYKVIVTKKNWYQARDNCNSLESSSYLLRINDEQESKFVTDNLVGKYSVNDNIWLGLNDIDQGKSF